MPNKFQRREIGKEIYFSSVNDPRFKLNMISVNFFAPLSEETASENAIALNILTKSCAEYPTFAALNNKLSSLYAARLGSGAMSAGDSQILTVSVTCIDNKYALQNEKVDEEAIGILLGCLFEPLLENGVFTEKITSLERQSLIDDIEAELNDKQSYANHKAAEIMYEGEPSAIRSIGSAEHAKRVTPFTAFSAYKRLLSNCRIEIFCSGCSDFKNAEKTLTRAFTSIERGDIFPCVSVKSKLKAQPKYVEEKLAVTQSKLAMGFKTDCDDHPAFQLMSAIYGGTTTSKLFANVREKMSLCYYCWATGLNRRKGSMFVRSGVENENIEKAQKEILAQLEAVKKGDFTDEDIENAKMYRKNNLKTYNDSLSQMAAWYLACIYDDDIRSPEDAIAEEEKVTKERIIQAAQSVKLDTVYVLTSLDEEETEE